MWPFKPAWMSFKSAKAEEAVKRVKSQKTLRKIVFSGALPSVQEIAISRIRDDAILKEIVTSDLANNIRCLAVSCITDQAFLKNVAAKHAHQSFRICALEAITDLDFLRSRLEHELLLDEKLVIYKALGMSEDVSDLESEIALREDWRLLDIAKKSWMHVSQDKARDAIAKIRSVDVLKEAVRYFYTGNVGGGNGLGYWAIRQIKDLGVLNDLLEEVSSASENIFYDIENRASLFRSSFSQYPHIEAEMIKRQEERIAEASRSASRDAFTDDSKGR